MKKKSRKIKKLNFLIIGALHKKKHLNFPVRMTADKKLNKMLFKSSCFIKSNKKLINFFKKKVFLKKFINDSCKSA